MGWDQVEDAPHLSASQIGMYLRCPKQYEYRYIKRMVRPPTFALVVGSSVHKSIELNYLSKFRTKKPENKNACLDAFNQTFEEKKAEVEDDLDQTGKQKDRGYEMAATHYDIVAPTFQPLEAPEVEFNVSVPGVKRKLFGFMDAIGTPIVSAAKSATAKAKRLIMDNKTSKRKYDRLSVEVSSQLTAYDFAHRELYGKKSDGVGFDVLVNKKDTTEVQRLVTTREDGEIKRFVEGVQMVDKGINAGVFPPVDNPQTCSWCGYKDICNKAATRRAAAFETY